VTRWLRVWGGQGLWLLGLAPLWIAFAGSLAAWTSYWCNGRPFLAKTRLKIKPW
jgi:hypothetical protein